jgi:hypothetical protein
MVYIYALKSPRGVRSAACKITHLWPQSTSNTKGIETNIHINLYSYLYVSAPDPGEMGNYDGLFLCEPLIVLRRLPTLCPMWHNTKGELIF